MEGNAGSSCRLNASPVHAAHAAPSGCRCAPSCVCGGTIGGGQGVLQSFKPDSYLHCLGASHHRPEGPRTEGSVGGQIRNQTSNRTLVRLPVPAVGKSRRSSAVKWRTTDTPAQVSQVSETDWNAAFQPPPPFPDCVCLLLSPSHSAGLVCNTRTDTQTLRCTDKFTMIHLHTNTVSHTQIHTQ